MPTSLTPQEFVKKWDRTELKEKSSAQEHFIDICRMLDHGTPAEDDPEGTWFTFEYGATKLSGEQGWADVWKKDHFGWEYKSKDKDLDDAYDQLLQYRESLLNPPLLIVCDINTTIIHTNFTNSVKQEYEISLEDLLDHEKRELLRKAFFRPQDLEHEQTAEQVTEQAAEKFGALAEIMERWGEDPQKTAHFLIQILFCLFAEDIGILPHDVLTRILNMKIKLTSDVTKPLSGLFQAMADGEWFGEHKIRRIDGGLFEDGAVVNMPGDAIKILKEVSVLDWSSIEPSAIGTLFERSLDPTKRAQLGAHYTSREDIELVVDPVLMDPLRSEWHEIAEQIGEIRETLETSRHPGEEKKLIAQVKETVDKFLAEISSIQILDPACGSGNFLYVALSALLDLQKEVIVTARDIGIEGLAPSVSPLQMRGIEINTYAHELAEATIWIGYIQWLYQNGYGYPDEPILQPIDSIFNHDAILLLDGDNSPLEPDWPDANVIIGNPPYLGSRKMRPSLGDDYCNALAEVYEDRFDGVPDLVCYWFDKARRLIESGKSNRAGLLATQAIRGGGTNRQVLDAVKQSGDIFMAWSDREWILDGATVHVSIVGFDDGSQSEKTLDGAVVEDIFSDLTAAVDLSSARPLRENADLSFQGVVLRGPFNIRSGLVDRMMRSGGNPNGRPNSDVIKRRMTGQDLTGKPSNESVIDFGVNMSLKDAAMYAMPFKYVKENVLPVRKSAKQARARDEWWLHWRPREKMRGKLAGLSRYIATSRVGKHRIFGWLEPDILPDTALVVFARDDDYFFGVLHSKIHELWARRMGTQLRDAESGFRYTSTTVFGTFPFPWPPGEEDINSPKHKLISERSKDLVKQREAWSSQWDGELEGVKKGTLTDLYNENPTWLQNAHKELDDAVLDAYGWVSDIDQSEIIGQLLNLNHTRQGPDL